MGGPTSMTACRSKTSVDACAVPTPSPRERKMSFPLCWPVKTAAHSTLKARVVLPSSRTVDSATRKHGAPSRRTS